MTFKKQRGSHSPKKNKPRKIYLNEPHDYFGINYFLKMQERQRELAQAGLLTHPHPMKIDNGQDSSQLVNGIVPSKCWRAYDLHNKPRSLYSEEEKRIAALESYNRTAVSVPLREVLATKFRNVFSNWSSSSRHESEEPLFSRSRSVSETESVQSLSSVSSSNTGCSMASSGSQSSPGKQVHFSPDTIFCERDDKTPFRTKLLQKRELQALKRAEKEERLRPRPFLPFLESGLSYCDDEEFYRLKNSDAHRNPQVILSQKSRQSQKSNRCWKVIIKALRFIFCCMVEEESSSYRGPMSQNSSSNSNNSGDSLHSFRFHDELYKRSL